MIINKKNWKQTLTFQDYLDTDLANHTNYAKRIKNFEIKFKCKFIKASGKNSDNKISHTTPIFQRNEITITSSKLSELNKYLTDFYLPYTDTDPFIRKAKQIPTKDLIKWNKNGIYDEILKTREIKSTQRVNLSGCKKNTKSKVKEPKGLTQNDNRVNLIGSSLIFKYKEDKWDKNYKMYATKISREEAKILEQIAKEYDTSVFKLIKGYLKTLCKNRVNLIGFYFLWNCESELLLLFW